MSLVGWIATVSLCLNVLLIDVVVSEWQERRYWHGLYESTLDRPLDLLTRLTGEETGE